MTRFARAKGSKSSNERVPEPATQWGEFKNQLIQKNSEKINDIAREKAFEQRTANYKAFLKEREEDEAKNIAWAEFPGNDNSRKPGNHSNSNKKPGNHSNKKRKQCSLDSVTINNVNKSQTNDNWNLPDLSVNKNEQVKKNEEKFIQIVPNFNQLKDKLHKVLADNSDSDAPPEEASAKNKSEEVVVKKEKTKKRLLKIVQDRQNRHDYSTENTGHTDMRVNSEKNKKTGKNTTNEQLSEKSLLKIEKKRERYKKQLEKKKQKKLEQKNNRQLTQDAKSSLVAEKALKKIANKGKIKTPIEPEYDNENLTDKEILRIQKKKERRARQAEKRKKRREMGPEEKQQNESEESGSTNDLKKKLSEEDLLKIQKKKEKLAKQAEKRRKFKEQKLLEKNIDNSKKGEDHKTQDKTVHVEYKRNIEKSIKTETSTEANVNARKHSEQPSKIGFKTNPTQTKFKTKDGKFSKIKKPSLKPETMFINGRTVDIDYVDGFPIKKEDAERIRQLRQDMIKKELPRTEIDVALKLERRRAEKALAREKKNVCFNCRKSGHNLSDCPELGTDQMVQSAGTGICFKCGSTEHTHFECRVERGEVYKFASCFICNEQGHIAKQCPDNQRGLYPKGGSCKVCGDVTHLKKDCPKYQVQQQHLQSSLSVGTIDNRNPDDLENSGGLYKNSRKDVMKHPKPNTVVKF